MFPCLFPFLPCVLFFCLFPLLFSHFCPHIRFGFGAWPHFHGYNFDSWPFLSWHYLHGLLLLNLSWRQMVPGTSIKELTQIGWLAKLSWCTDPTKCLSSLNSVCFIFPEADSPNWAGHVAFMKNSLSLVACLPLNSFEAILELSLSKIIPYGNFHHILITKSSINIHLICITICQIMLNIKNTQI